eukprot:gene1300-1316_t
MTFSAEELPAVAKAAHAVMREAMEAGVWIVGGGFEGLNAHVVDAAGKVTEGQLKATPVYIGGFSVIEVQSEQEAHEWARKFAESCRCSQEVRRIMDDPEQEALQRK